MIGLGIGLDRSLAPLPPEVLPESQEINGLLVDFKEIDSKIPDYSSVDTALYYSPEDITFMTEMLSTQPDLLESIEASGNGKAGKLLTASNDVAWEITRIDLGKNRYMVSDAAFVEVATTEQDRNFVQHKVIVQGVESLDSLTEDERTVTVTQFPGSTPSSLCLATASSVAISGTNISAGLIAIAAKPDEFLNDERIIAAAPFGAMSDELNKYGPTCIVADITSDYGASLACRDALSVVYGGESPLYPILTPDTVSAAQNDISLARNVSALLGHTHYTQQNVHEDFAHNDSNSRITCTTLPADFAQIPIELSLQTQFSIEFAEGTPLIHGSQEINDERHRTLNIVGYTTAGELFFLSATPWLHFNTVADIAYFIQKITAKLGIDVHSVHCLDLGTNTNHVVKKEDGTKTRASRIIHTTPWCLAIKK